MLTSHWGRAATGNKKVCIYAHRVAAIVSDSLRPCRLSSARLLCQGGVFSRREYWSVLASTGCHTLLERYVYCRPSHRLLSTWCCQNSKQPNQAAEPPAHWPSLGQTQGLQGSLRSKPQWTTRMQSWK